MDEQKLRILLAGAGGVGVYFSSILAKNGAEVKVIARHDHETVSRDGYFIDDRGEAKHFTPAGVLRSAAEYDGVADFIVIAPKALPEIDLPRLVRDAVRDRRTALVLIQNGIDIEKGLAAAFPDNPLLSCVANIAVSRPAPGRLLNQGMIKLVVGGPAEPTARLVDYFKAGGIDCRGVDKIEPVRWHKLVWNIAFNPVSVLAGGVTTGELCDRGETENLCRSLMRETAAIAARRGVSIPDDEQAAAIESARNIPQFRTSMVQDFLAGRPLEVEAILGNTVRIARAAGVAVPVMECCYALLKSIDAQQRRRAEKK
ncbi:MAG: 2-dehydropantoate 2-reductase [Victivallaceae bacterium]|nr:2-dehydropantoate 2-reductase [Victivallaceae bacterium]